MTPTFVFLLSPMASSSKGEHLFRDHYFCCSSTTFSLRVQTTGATKAGCRRRRHVQSRISVLGVDYSFDLVVSLKVLLVRVRGGSTGIPARQTYRTSTCLRGWASWVEARTRNAFPTPRFASKPGSAPRPSRCIFGDSSVRPFAELLDGAVLLMSRTNVSSVARRGELILVR